MAQRDKHILMVLDQSFPPDIRVENEASTLAKAGFNVTLMSISPEKKASRETYKGFTVLRRYLPAQIRNKMRGLAGTLPLLSWYLERELTKTYREMPFDILHAHDLYLFGGVLRAGKRLGLPVVGDLHENYVEALKRYAWSTRPPGKWVISIPRWEKLEKEWVNAVDHLIVVIEEAADRNVKLGVSPEHITVIPNTINLEEFDSYPTDDFYRRQNQNRFIITYTGGIDVHRGVESTIRAIPKIAKYIPNILLTIVGDGRIRPELEQLASNLNLGNFVQFEGWQPQEKLLGYMISSDICLIPHLRTPHTDATIPHKLFHYMYAGKPIVGSNCKPIKRIIEENECGLIYEADDPESFSRKIIDLYNEPQMCKTMGLNGKNAVSRTYNWSETAQNLIHLYEQLAF